MQILVHIGLNKCASTYIQAALASAQATLRRHGVFYAVEGSLSAQYGLSRYYGFGPDAERVTKRSLSWLAAEADRRNCARVIISSEYLSLCRPAAIAKFATDLENLGADAQFLMYSRDVIPWLHSLFNQYVKTVENGPQFASLDDFASHVLDNGAIDVARRYRAWTVVVGEQNLMHCHIARAQQPAAVLAPFIDFAGLDIQPPSWGANRSLAPGALYLTSLLRQSAPNAGRNLLIARIASSECAWVQIPGDFLQITQKNMTRLEAEISSPMAALPHTVLSAEIAA